MARTGMTDLIDTVRGMTDAGTGDYTVGTITYWADNEVQRVLDRHREDVYQLQAAPITTLLGGGTVAYYTYYLNRVNIESGTAAFTLEDATGADIGTSAYTLDAAGGIVTFGTDTAGSSYYWTGRAYDLNAAAADIWRMKAANAAKMFDFSTDNHSVKRSQFAAQCLQMANYYEGQATPVSVLMYREDMTNHDRADND